MFSVVIPLYNKRDEIERCLRSVLAQTFEAFEVLVVNDGATDGSDELVRRFTDPRIRLIDQQNAGVAAARNRGIAEAGEWVAFLDADDSWLPEHLATLDALRRGHPSAAFLFTGYWVDRGRGMKRLIRYAGSLGAGYLSMPDGLVVPSCTAFRRAALLDAGGYREMFGEDVDLWFRVGSLYEAASSPKATAVWHVDAANRRCDDEAASTAKYIPGSLLASYQFIASKGSAAEGLRAKQYVRRRERRAIWRVLRAGDAQHARFLYRWWQETFDSRDRMVELGLAMPGWLHAFAGLGVRCVDRMRSAFGYAVARLTA